MGPKKQADDDEKSPVVGRYRLNVSLQATNLTNRPNYGGYSGVMTSPYFRSATSVQPPRKIDLGLTFSF
ncbi:MAG TPA: hypothetical protein VMZ90_00470 [Vicinamibacterales bacterium]|nr:hypothetical protein [Vicinamibacterales bacterium]